MKTIFAVSLLAGAFYVIWWGYKNLLRRERDQEFNVVQGATCQICRGGFPMSELVIREKNAGFENYFCGPCIASLAEDYNAKVREGTAPVIVTGHVLDGSDGAVVHLN